MERRSPPAGVASETDGSVTVRLHRPPETASAPFPAVLWIHGGGFVMGSPAQDDAVCQVFAHKLGAVVAAVKYQRAPEHPFPAALHDGLEWLATLDDVDPARIAIGGASAGGGLAAALALLARERAVVTPRLQLLSYPMLDDRTVLRTDLDERYFRLWNNAENRFGWASYLGSEPGAPGSALWPRPAARRTSPASRRRGSGSAPWTCSSTRTWPTPHACAPQACRVNCMWSRVRSTASTRSPRRRGSRARTGSSRCRRSRPRSASLADAPCRPRSARRSGARLRLRASNHSAPKRPTIRSASPRSVRSEMLRFPS